jgi:hypothetical protein
MHGVCSHGGRNGSDCTTRPYGTAVNVETSMPELTIAA